MLQALALLLVCQLAGEVTSQVLGLPVPGPVVGMVLLLALTMLVPETASRVRDTSNTILQHLSLLFVPAGVGVMLHVTTVRDEWLAIMSSLLLGTLLTLVITALAIKLVMRLFNANRTTERR